MTRSILMLAGICAMASALGAPDGPKAPPPLVIRPLESLAGRVPEHGAASVEPAKQWEFAFVTGNGRMGAMAFGHPAQETIVLNHCRLFLPLGSREKVPDLAQYLSELRRTIREKGYGPAMQLFLGKAREQGFPGLTWADPFHPGAFLTVAMPYAGEVRDYLRTEDFETGEVLTRWRDDAGAWQRRLFISRTQNVAVLSITGPGAAQVACALTPEPVGDQRIRSELKVDAGWVAYHNTYEHGKGGFDTVMRVVPHGGKVECDGRAIRVEGANLPKWKAMLAKLPPYRVNEDGALAEWVPQGDGEHYRHRHLSHLHAAYEANGELTPEGTPEIWKAGKRPRAGASRATASSRLMGGCTWGWRRPPWGWARRRTAG